MKRILALIAVLTFVSAAPAFAQSKFDFSAKAAGIDKMVKADAPALARARQAANGKKSFWKTPWPYVIIGGAIAAGVIIAANGDGSGY